MSPPSGRDRPDRDLAAAIEEASRSLGVEWDQQGGPGDPGGPGGPDDPDGPGGPGGRGGPGERGREGEGASEGWRRVAWVVAGLAVAGVVTALALRGPGSGGQPAHLVEADLRWAVARVVEHVEEERLLRGEIPGDPELRLLLGEALSFSAGEDGGYTVVGQRDGVRVEYDGSVPLEEWSGRTLHPPGASGGSGGSGTPGTGSR